LLLGSIAEKVVNHASCSVDVVKTQYLETEKILGKAEVGDSACQKQTILAG
jgi:hypothetical protein